jgi:hypothetical protein
MSRSHWLRRLTGGRSSGRELALAEGAQQPMHVPYLPRPATRRRDTRPIEEVRNLP